MRAKPRSSSRRQSTSESRNKINKASSYAIEHLPFKWDKKSPGLTPGTSPVLLIIRCVHLADVLQTPSAYGSGQESLAPYTSHAAGMAVRRILCSFPLKHHVERGITLEQVLNLRLTTLRLIPIVLEHALSA